MGGAPAEWHDPKPHHRQWSALIHLTKAAEQKQTCETFDWLEVPEPILSSGNMNLEHFCAESIPCWVCTCIMYTYLHILDSSWHAGWVKSLSLLESTYKLHWYFWAVTNFCCNSSRNRCLLWGKRIFFFFVSWVYQDFIEAFWTKGTSEFERGRVGTFYTLIRYLKTRTPMIVARFSLWSQIRLLHWRLESCESAFNKEPSDKPDAH